MSTTSKQLPISKINLVGALVGYLIGDWAGAILVFIIPYKTVLSWLNRPITPRVQAALPATMLSHVMPEAADLAGLNPLLKALDRYFSQCRNDCPSCPVNVPGQPCALVMNIYPSMPSEGVEAYYLGLFSYLGAIREAIIQNNTLRKHEIQKDQAIPRLLYLGTGAAILWGVQFLLTYLAGVL